MAELNFNATEVEPNVGFAPIPAGDYVAVITDDEMKDNRAGNGRYLQLQFEIIEGDFKGRKLWARLNLDNPNADAVKIARADLSAICHAVGVLQLKDSCELHNLPLVISVKVKKNKDTDELTNSIAAYKSKQAAAAPRSGAASPKPPWAK